METADLTGSSNESLRALGYILTAWDEGTDSGVPGELMAFAALYTALTDLVTVFGEDAVAGLTEGLVVRVRQGEFTLGRKLQ